MMLLVFVCFAKIFLGIFIEGPLASRGTEVVCLSLVFRRASRSRGLNIHSTYSVMYGVCHINHLLVFNRIIALTRRVRESKITRKRMRNIAYWFPQQTLETAIYLQLNEDVDFKDADARLVVSEKFSSAAGSSMVHQELQRRGVLPQAPGQGGSCAN